MRDRLVRPGALLGYTRDLMWRDDEIRSRVRQITPRRRRMATISANAHRLLVEDANGDWIMVDVRPISTLRARWVQFWARFWEKYE